MPFESLGDFIKAAEAVGEVQYVEGADLELDVGGLTELTAERGGPMLVFDKFAGYPAGYRVCANANRTLRRFALAMDLPIDIHPLELLRRWRDKRAGSVPISAKVVKDGPVLANMQQGDDVNIESFPAPRWHPGDGGRYIGTQDMVIVRDPEQGWVNMGCYRAMIQRRDRISLWINPQKHGRILAQKYWQQGKAAPVAVVFGCEPVTWMTASMSPPFGTSEYELAGAYRGSPVDVVELPLTKLPVPAQAEIVVEGVIPPESEETAIEGPFGEWPGYYTHQGPEAVVRIQRIYYRDNPIIAGAPPLRPINWSNFTNYVHLWEHLERSGITDVAGVWGFYNGLLTVVSLKPALCRPRQAGVDHGRGFSPRRYEDLLRHRRRGYRSDQSRRSPVGHVHAGRSDDGRRCGARCLDRGSRSARFAGAPRGGRLDRRAHADQRVQALRLARSICQDQRVQRRRSQETSGQMGRVAGEDGN